MGDMAFVCVVALVCVVGIVAICYGRKFTCKVDGDGAEVSMTGNSNLPEG